METYKRLQYLTNECYAYEELIRARALRYHRRAARCNDKISRTSKTAETLKGEIQRKNVPIQLELESLISEAKYYKRLEKQTKVDLRNYKNLCESLKQKIASIKLLLDSVGKYEEEYTEEMKKTKKVYLRPDSKSVFYQVDPVEEWRIIKEALSNLDASCKNKLQNVRKLGPY